MDWWIPSFLPSKSQYHLKVTPCPNLVPPHGKWPIDNNLHRCHVELFDWPQLDAGPCGVVWLAPIGCGSKWSCLICPNLMQVRVELFDWPQLDAGPCGVVDWPQLDAGPCGVVWLAPIGCRSMWSCLIGPTGCGSMWSRLIGPNFQQLSSPQIWTLWMGQTSRVQL